MILNLPTNKPVLDILLKEIIIVMLAMLKIQNLLL